MIDISKQQKGDLSIFAMSFLWAFFPVITVLSYSTLEPLPALTLSTLFAAVFFAAILTAKKKWHELAHRSALIYIFYVTLFSGVGYYLFYFIALKHTTAGNASLVALLETFFSYLFFTVWKREYFSLRHIIGAVFMIIGAVIVLLPNATAFNVGDLLVIAAVICAPFGNYFSQKARQQVSSETIMFVRSLLAFPILLFISYIFAQHFTLTQVKGVLWFLLINGVLLLGFSKILWLEAIHRISVTRANALSSVSPLLTLFFAYLFLNQIPTIFQLIAFVPLFVGLLLLTSSKPFPFWNNRPTS